MLRRYALRLGALILLIVGGTAAHARPAKCLLSVAGRTYIDGLCDFRALTARKGDFQITGAGSLYFAYLYVEKDGNGTGYWNEAAGAGHAHTPLGRLIRDGACWNSDTVKLCAW